MPNADRFEAVGPRGEACIIIRSRAETVDSDQPGDPAPSRPLPTYCLATGERLQPTGAPGGFETLDGKRKFTLR